MAQPHAGQTAGTSWNPGQYLRFSDHRLRPALELMDRIPLDTPNMIYDLGCGTGHITRIIAERWSSAAVIGIDNSEEMLQKAGTEKSTVVWRQADIASWTPENSPDLIYSNATLQWIPDHEQLLPRLVSYLNQGGCLAVQMPLSWSAPSHQIMRETLVDSGVGSDELRQSVDRKWVADAEVYYDLLTDHVATLDIWETEYIQALEGEDPVLEWVKGTGLRPILNSLNDEERDVYLTEYRQRLRAVYPTRSDGITLYPFRRLFLVACV